MRFSTRVKLLSLAAGIFIFTSLQGPQPSHAQANGCGPEGFGFLIPDGPFSSACDSHDLCYEDASVSQAECDRQFKDDMYTICESGSSGLSVDACKTLADYYHGSVANLGEVFIVLDGRSISGEIVSVDAKRVDDWWGDDEFEACVTFKNNGDINTEYDLQLYSANGSLIDTEPDTYEINLVVGETARECVGTDGIYPSISDLGGQYKIVLRVDAPQQSLFDNLFNDFVPVDWLEDTTP
ncbi:MAG: phospholipase A2 [Cyanobacteria bacterium P01_F01_bin.150]